MKAPKGPPGRRPHALKPYPGPGLKRLASARMVIRALGGPKAVSNAYERSIGTVANWALRSKIPVILRDRITADLRERGYEPSQNIWGYRGNRELRPEPAQQEPAP